MGYCIAEEPFVSLPGRDGRSRMEYTDFVFRSILRTGFDLSVLDVEMSDYIFTVDFPSVWRLLDYSNADDSLFDKSEIEKVWDEQKNLSSSTSKKSNSYMRLMDSKTRAGYSSTDDKVLENLNYYGKLNTDNPVVLAYWESIDRQDDPRLFDFTVGILNDESVIRFHECQNGTWRSRFKIAGFKYFEDEPIPYGIGRIGRKQQREQDLLLSRIHDLVTMGTYSMWKVGKYSGLKMDQMVIRPNGIVEMEDINQMERLGVDVNAILQALNLLSISKDDFRTLVGASSNLQAESKGTSATETAIVQNETKRSSGVHAEIIAETFLREHLEQRHFNNLVYLDEPIWVSATGEHKPGFYDKNNLPANIGIKISTVLDKDFKPERILRLRETLDLVMNLRNNVPRSINAVEPLFDELFRALGMDPRLLRQPVPLDQQFQNALLTAQRSGHQPSLDQEQNAMIGSASAGGGSQEIDGTVPLGAVPEGQNPTSGLLGL
jgi:hypothetical protein